MTDPAPPPAPDGDAKALAGRLARLPWRKAAPLVAAGAAALAAAWVRLRRGGTSEAEPEPPPLTPEDWDAAEPRRGRAAAAPWEIPPRGWKDILWRAWRGSGRHRLGALAGGVTFFLLLATFPALAAIVAVYGLFLDIHHMGAQLSRLAQVFPPDAVDLIAGQMTRLASQKHGTLSAALVISTLVSVWSANAGMKALFDGVNIAYEEVEKRPYLRRTLVAYVATFGALLFITGAMVLAVAAPAFLHTLGFHGGRLWSAPLRWLLIYLAAAFAFTLLYRHGPSRRLARWRWVGFGGAVAALLWMTGSMGFSAYLSTFTHVGAYGSLGAMIGFMLWVWFSVTAVLMGAELNAEIEHQTACDTTIGEFAPLGERGAVKADTVGRAFTVSPREARDYVRDFIARQIDWVRRLFSGRARLF